MRFDTRPGLYGPIFAALLLTVAPQAYSATEFTVNGVDVDSHVVDMYVESRAQKPVAQVSDAQRSELIRELTDIYLITTQARVDELVKQPDVQAQLELQKRGLLARIAAGDYLAKNAATDEEILEEYAQQIKLAPNRQFKARHILVESQTAATDLIAELDDGADFEELAKSNSTGPSGPNGGDLGWFAPDQMVKPFSDAVTELEDGSYTREPVQTQFGWHVILREGSRDSEPPTLDSVRESIKNRVEQRKLQEYIEQLRALNDG